MSEADTIVSPSADTNNNYGDHHSSNPNHNPNAARSSAATSMTIKDEDLSIEQQLEEAQRQLEQLQMQRQSQHQLLKQQSKQQSSHAGKQPHDRQYHGGSHNNNFHDKHYIYKDGQERRLGQESDHRNRSSRWHENHPQQLSRPSSTTTTAREAFNRTMAPLSSSSLTKEEINLARLKEERERLYNSVMNYSFQSTATSFHDTRQMQHPQQQLGNTNSELAYETLQNCSNHNKNGGNRGDRRWGASSSSLVTSTIYKAKRSMKGNSRQLFLLIVVILFLFQMRMMNHIAGSNDRHVEAVQRSLLPGAEPDEVYNIDSLSPEKTLLERHHNGKLLFKCSLKAGNKKSSYSAASLHNRPGNKKRRLATAITFQSNSGHQLQSFMSHYSPVLGYHGIVIIDHQTSDRDVDPYTSSLLQSYQELGSDVWRCDGSFLYKAEMWSDVISQYANQEEEKRIGSEWVFPLDVDEFVTVLRPKNKETKVEGVNIRKEEQMALSWNYDDLSKALRKLPDTGKPFKMEGGSSIPSDCRFMWPELNNTSLSSSSLVPSHSMPKPTMKHHAARRKSHVVHCMDKVFMRSTDFEATDGGNHLGKTLNVPQLLCPDGEQTHQPALPEQLSDLFLIHAQQNTFEEWVLHGLRGASTRGYNKFQQYNKKKCQRGMVSLHYCQFWSKAVLKTELDPWRMKRLYREEVCEGLKEKNELIEVVA